jgi:hypothetical protein
VLATAELYGSKLVAAMDRQHPRDIFDVIHMLDHFGWQASFVDCFVAYIAGHNRPVHEVLFPKTKPLEPAFTNEFAGMTRNTVELSTLEQMQVRLLQELPRQLTPAHRAFLLSLVQGDPAWVLMPMRHLGELPALKWKLRRSRTSRPRSSRVPAFPSEKATPRPPPASQLVAAVAVSRSRTPARLRAWAQARASAPYRRQFAAGPGSPPTLGASLCAAL